MTGGLHVAVGEAFAGETQDAGGEFGGFGVFGLLAAEDERAEDQAVVGGGEAERELGEFRIALVRADDDQAIGLGEFREGGRALVGGEFLDLRFGGEAGEFRAFDEGVLVRGRGERDGEEIREGSDGWLRGIRDDGDARQVRGVGEGGEGEEEEKSGEAADGIHEERGRADVGFSCQSGQQGQGGRIKNGIYRKAAKVAKGRGDQDQWAWVMLDDLLPDSPGSPVCFPTSLRFLGDLCGFAVKISVVT